MQSNPLSKRILFVGRALLSCAVLVYLVGIVDWERVRIILPQVGGGRVLVSYLLLHGSLLAMAVRWSLLLGWLGIGQSVTASWRYYLTGSFYSILLPGVIGGDVVRIGMSVAGHRGGKLLTASSVLFERICGLAAMFAIAAVTVAWASNRLHLEPRSAEGIVVFASAGLLGFAGGFLIWRLLPERLLARKRERGEFLGKLLDRLGPFRDLTLRHVLMILFVSATAHLLSFASAFFLARAIGLDLSFVFFLAVMPVVFVMTVLPVSLGGLGVREGVLAFFLVRAGVPSTDAVVLALLLYLNMIFVGGAGALLELGRIGRFQNFRTSVGD